MKAIVNFAVWLANTISTIWEYITMGIDNMIFSFRILMRVRTLAYNIILTIPPVLRAFATITILVSTLYFIIGRENGGSN